MSGPGTGKVSLHTAIVRTPNLEALARFYGQGLGLGEPEAEGEDHLGYPLANAYLGFDLVPSEVEPGEAVSLWFDVEDIQATFEAFLALGARVRYPPTRHPWGAVLASMYDPDGNLFGLKQRDGGEG